VRENCELVVGWFDDTLPKFVRDNSQAVAFLHIDCDLYSSTQTVLRLLRDRIRPGTIIVFDEYLNFPGWQQDEHRAWTEFARHAGIRFDYIGFVSRHQQVAVRVTGVVDKNSLFS
jgi:predicted O-methyltransferase YrrM